jgi:hypothetical protein
MNLESLTYQIKRKTDMVYADLFPYLKAKLALTGLKDFDIEDYFSIFDEVRQDIEKEMVILTLSTPYSNNAFVNNQVLSFNPIQIDILRDTIYRRYAFLYSDDSKFFARKCDITGALMNEGWVVFDDVYVASELALCNYLRIHSEEPEVDAQLTDDQLRDKYYENGSFFYTDWHHPTDITFAQFEGKTYRIQD